MLKTDDIHPLKTGISVFAIYVEFPKLKKRLKAAIKKKFVGEEVSICTSSGRMAYAPYDRLK